MIGVVCWVSRAMEKTIFLRFMFAMSILSIVMTLVELVQLTSKPVFRFVKRGIRASGCLNRVKNDPMTRNDFNKVHEDKLFQVFSDKCTKIPVILISNANSLKIPKALKIAAQSTYVTVLLTSRPIFTTSSK